MPDRAAAAAGGDAHAKTLPPSTGPLHIVFNPGSGAGEADRTRDAIRQACDDAGRSFDLITLDEPGRLPALAREAVRRARQDGGVVVAAGGDGTLNAVAQATLGSGCTFGVLPQGTFNYFGRTHGIPADTGQAMQVLLHAPVQPVQVGLVNGKVFLVNASLGLYPRLLEEREGWKQRFGRSRPVAFFAALATLLGNYRSLRLRIEVEGQARDVRTPTLFVGNNALQMEQLGFPMAQAIDDGALAAIMLKPVRRWTLLKLLMRGVLGQLGEADQVVSLACRRLSVHLGRPFAARRVKVATDGETAWLSLPLEFSVSPEPLWLIRPSAPAPERAAP
jgi:diacylglycerol kinase family enzyme